MQPFLITLGQGARCNDVLNGERVSARPKHLRYDAEVNGKVYLTVLAPRAQVHSGTNSGV